MTLSLHSTAISCIFLCRPFIQICPINIYSKPHPLLPLEAKPEKAFNFQYSLVLLPWLNNKQFRNLTSHDMHPFHFYVTMEKTSQNDSDCPSTSSPFFGLVDLFNYGSVFNKVQSFFSILVFLLSRVYSGDSRIREEKHFSESGLSHRESLSLPHGEDDGKLGRGEVKMVMGKLGFFCSPESDELEERYGSNEISGLFDEQEPSLEEVKQAFDVFDGNRDGVIDSGELQRVLCILGMREAMELENCQKMIGRFDENGDGRIDFNEFVKIVENSFC